MLFCPSQDKLLMGDRNFTLSLDEGISKKPIVVRALTKSKFLIKYALTLWI